MRLIICDSFHLSFIRLIHQTQSSIMPISSSLSIHKISRSKQFHKVCKNQFMDLEPWLVCTPWHANSLIFFRIRAGIPLNCVSYFIGSRRFIVFVWSLEFCLSHWPDCFWRSLCSYQNDVYWFCLKVQNFILQISYFAGIIFAGILFRRYFTQFSRGLFIQFVNWVLDAFINKDRQLGSGKVPRKSLSIPMLPFVSICLSDDFS